MEDLEERAIKQFDRLVEKGQLFWRQVPARHVPARPFDFEFRVATSLRSKPMDHEQKKSSNTNAFTDSDPDFELGRIGDHHKLILNKFCVERPQFVLPTVEFETQRSELTERDFHAGWTVLSSLPAHRYMVIFNGGPDAGSSVGHKHLQVIPLPDEFEQKFFGKATADKGEGISSIPGAPYRHAIHRISSTVDGDQLADTYDKMRSALDMSKDSPHNMLLTNDCLMVIPRRTAWIDDDEEEGSVACNAAGMVGIVWCWSEEQYEAWMHYGPMRALARSGVPPDQERL